MERTWEIGVWLLIATCPHHSQLLPVFTSPHKSTALCEHQYPPLLPGSAWEKGEWPSLLWLVLGWITGAGEQDAVGAQLSHTKMSCYDLCPPKTSVAVPQPIAESCNELCARQCPDSTAFIQPPPVVVTFPGPILSSFPQQAVVGSSGAPAFGGSLGLGGLYGAGATQGSGGLCTFGRPYASPACNPCALPRYSRKLWNTCGPC
ncbi:LOW QUALITY PROTEIN: scale keratin-like [Lagopus muta]|uniref:LOW QUALITY PROTEIN: scale keratin-like n=2 Tax=Lagopus muta TaxID=64668 RepID=UPI00209E7BC5|nr:LOW QUALITY PROTEIN: scale keratin-like [Lagopus muta]